MGSVARAWSGGRCGAGREFEGRSGRRLRGTPAPGRRVPRRLAAGEEERFRGAQPAKARASWGSPGRRVGGHDAARCQDRLRSLPKLLPWPCGSFRVYALVPPVLPVPVPPAPLPLNLPPKPLRQPLGPGLLTVMDFALMVAVLLALPKALAHWPTTAAALVAGTVWVTVVEAPRVTVMAVGAGASSHAQSPASPWV